MAEHVIFGAGGHAHVIASFLEGPVTFVVPHEPRGTDQMTQTEFFGRIGSFRHAAVYIGIGENAARRRIFDQLFLYGRRPAVCIAKTAFVARDAEFGPGAVVCAGAVIGTRARIGANTIVNSLSGIDHDCVLGDDSQVTIGVSFGGGVITGSNCFFGMKSGLFPRVVLGRDVKVMAGSLVVKDADDGVLLGGSPARIIRGYPKGEQT